LPDDLRGPAVVATPLVDLGQRRRREPRVAAGRDGLAGDLIGLPVVTLVGEDKPGQQGQTVTVEIRSLLLEELLGLLRVAEPDVIGAAVRAHCQNLMRRRRSAGSAHHRRVSCRPTRRSRDTELVKVGERWTKQGGMRRLYDPGLSPARYPWVSWTSSI